MIDFTWDELQTLEMTENFSTENGVQNKYIQEDFRYGLLISDFIPLKMKLNLFKVWKNQQGKRLEFIRKLKHRGFIIKTERYCQGNIGGFEEIRIYEKTDLVYLQTFDYNELKRIKQN